ncbi:hypothetical protein C7C46_20415 [Streptomyces tateyamensis]|uniref:Uncharacterized protein n=1 Tax=Streptomyces tateyamensis TaxID=565073 RepID=A0A2V4ND66_9ACTN|nr:hypothetical protein [Streptomyces tateyamensis]PYC77093.1 hypothetical protein C7C46_20415 [Streptomyces tateyamensis]
MFDALNVVGVLLALFCVATVTLVLVGAVKVTRAVVRKVERTEAQARRAVENAALKAKTFTKPGAQGELAAIRLHLRTALTGTREVLENGLASDRQLTEALTLLARLDTHGAELDGELRMLEREPDQARVTAKLGELRERADRITHSAESLRWAAQDRMQRFAADELGRLSEECENEAGALRHWDAPAAGAAGTAGAGAGAGRGGARPGLGSGAGRVGAEDLLGLGERFTQRLRKPSPGSSAG